MKAVTLGLCRSKRSLMSAFGKSKGKHHNDGNKGEMVLSQNYRLAIEGGLYNNNVIAVGKAGSGKTRGVMIPNVLQETGSYIINDQYGEIYDACGELLKADGYNVVEVDALEADTLDASDFDVASIGSAKTAVFITGKCFLDEEKSTRKAKLYADLFTNLVNYASKQDAGHLKVPVMFVYDDFASIGAILYFWKEIVTCRGYGITFLMSVQCLSQLEDTYSDDEEYLGILANSDTKLLLGCGDAPDDKMSKYLTENGVDIARCKGYNDEVILVRGMKPIYDRTFGFRSNQKKACAPVQ